MFRAMSFWKLSSSSQREFDTHRYCYPDSGIENRMKAAGRASRLGIKKCKKLPETSNFHIYLCIKLPETSKVTGNQDARISTL